VLEGYHRSGSKEREKGRRGQDLIELFKFSRKNSSAGKGEAVRLYLSEFAKEFRRMLCLRQGRDDLRWLAQVQRAIGERLKACNVRICLLGPEAFEDDIDHPEYQ